MGGAAVWLTAVAVPYRKFDDLNVRRMRCKTGDAARRMMAALTVETQPTMGGGEGERMRVVRALR
jgi:hypothetical protein